jgi:hypothetical protein
VITPERQDQIDRGNHGAVPPQPCTHHLLLSVLSMW